MVDRLHEEGSTCWRIARANRAAVLVDGSNYFPAVRSAMMKAEKSIYIVGWDIDSRMRLDPLRDPQKDSVPDRLGEFLTWLAKRKPDIRIHVLLWDYSVLFALEREPLPKLNLDWKTPRQIEVCLDDVLPLGASHHQKIVVVDDAVAFSGGMDLTIRRWDTPEHRPQQNGRVDHAGAPYGPFHDIQMVVDGDAALALSELVRQRWAAATCMTADPVSPRGDPWPDGVKADFADVNVALSRTIPGNGDFKQVNEVEELFRSAVLSAERYIYIENQYVALDEMADALSRRLKQKSHLHCIIISPKDPGGWIEARTMIAGRARFMKRLRDAGVADRVFLRYPVTSEAGSESAVMVHAKTMIVDDRFLRVGSANLNHRSMGLDSECDLSIEASNDEERSRIVSVRNRLLGEHLGLRPAEIAGIMDASDFSWAGLLSMSRSGQELKTIDEDDQYDNELSRALAGIADPERPIESAGFVGDMFQAQPARPRIRRVAKLMAAAAVLLGLVALWQFTPLADLTDPATLKPWFDSLAASRWVYFIVPALYVVGGLVVFPITVLIALTGMAFGPWMGFLLAAGSSFVSAAVSFAVGAFIGRGFLRSIMGRRLRRISQAMGRKGVFSVLAMRLVPIAPFTIINIAAGASHIGFRDYLVGTVLGMTPGILVMTALGDTLRRMWENPGAGNLALFALIVICWIGISVLAQVLMSRLSKRWKR